MCSAGGVQIVSLYVRHCKPMKVVASPCHAGSLLIESGVGLGIGVRCWRVGESRKGVFIEALAPNSPAAADGRLR